MPAIYVIAGPPEVGKSTSGYSFIPEGINILDPDQIADRYKKQGFTDYKDIGNFKFNDLLKKELFATNDFAVELNLGYESHYELVKSLKNFSTENSIKVILFFTDDIELCYQRANQRFLAGLHFVSPDVIHEMYNNMLPLLWSHFAMIDLLKMVNVSIDPVPKLCLEFDRFDNQLIASKELPVWTKTTANFVKDFIEQAQIKKNKIPLEAKKIKPKNRPKI